MDEDARVIHALAHVLAMICYSKFSHSVLQLRVPSLFTKHYTLLGA